MVSKAQGSSYETARRFQLSDAVASCYEAAVRLGRYEDCEIARQSGVPASTVVAARQTLLDLGLLLCEGEGETPVPIDPSVAESALTIPLARDIADRQETMARVRQQLRPLLDIYAKRPQPSAGSKGVRVIERAALVVAEITAAARRCRKEAVTIQPGGGRSAKTLEAAIERDRAMLENGVSMRVLYQHAARASAATRRYVRLVTDGGAKVRTTAELPDRLIIFDRERAFVPIPVPRQGGGPPGAVVVEEPALVAYLHKGFEGWWQAGIDFDPDRALDDRPVDDLRGAILRLMALGHKDDTVAHRVGMSTRTVRKYITAIANELGATSRFQAGVCAAYLGLVPDFALTRDAEQPDAASGGAGRRTDGAIGCGDADSQGQDKAAGFRGHSDR